MRDLPMIKKYANIETFDNYIICLVSGNREWFTWKPVERFLRDTQITFLSGDFREVIRSVRQTRVGITQTAEAEWIRCNGSIVHLDRRGNGPRIFVSILGTNGYVAGGLSIVISIFDVRGHPADGLRAIVIEG